MCYFVVSSFFALVSCFAVVSSASPVRVRRGCFSGFVVCLPGVRCRSFVVSDVLARSCPSAVGRASRRAPEVTPATEMGQLRQNFVLQSEAENEIYAGFLVSFSNQKPRMKFTPALFGFPFS